jgi:hypothetical protein
MEPDMYIDEYSAFDFEEYDIRCEIAKGHGKITPEAARKIINRKFRLWAQSK